MSKLKATSTEQIALLGVAASEGVLPKVESQVEFLRDLLDSKKAESEEAACAFIIAIGFFTFELSQKS